MTAPAGSIVVFSSVVIHRSGPNYTDRLRRAYIAQYSKEVITFKDGKTPAGSYERFLDGGRWSTRTRTEVNCRRTTGSRQFPRRLPTVSGVEADLT